MHFIEDIFFCLSYSKPTYIYLQNNGTGTVFEYIQLNNSNFVGELSILSRLLDHNPEGFKIFLMKKVLLMLHAFLLEITCVPGYFLGVLTSTTFWE